VNEKDPFAASRTWAIVSAIFVAATLILFAMAKTESEEMTHLKRIEQKLGIQ